MKFFFGARGIYVYMHLYRHEVMEHTQIKEGNLHRYNCYIFA